MKFYVYELSDPQGAVFYVGKGKGERVAHHEAEARRGVAGQKCERIRAIWAAGGVVSRRIVQRFALEAEAYAFEVERIRLHGIESLTNISIGGRGGRHRPRPLWRHPTAPALLRRAKRLLSDAGPDGTVEACGIDITEHVKRIAKMLERPVASAA